MLTHAARTGLPLIAGAQLLNCSNPPREDMPSPESSDARPGGVLKSLLDEDPATLDPITPSGGVGNQLAAFAYSRGSFPDGALEGDLAVHWEQPDESTLLLRLRDGVTFDRRPVLEHLFLLLRRQQPGRFPVPGTGRADPGAAA
jgi:ABC-type transport system substrate-binding protein